MWNLLAGLAGLVSIGQQAFIGLGAYGLFVAVDRFGIPIVPAVVVTALAVGGVALMTAVFAFRLTGGYFAIGTWVIAEVFRIDISNTSELGSGTGVTIQAALRMAPADRGALTYWLALTVGAGSIVVAAFIMRSRLGLALQALRDNEVAARSLGVNIFRAKLAIYLVAAIGCAAAGAVIYLQLLRIQPNAAFGVDWTAKMIFIVIIGGIGRIEGPSSGRSSSSRCRRVSRTMAASISSSWASSRSPSRSRAIRAVGHADEDQADGAVRHPAAPRAGAADSGSGRSARRRHRWSRSMTAPVPSRHRRSQFESPDE